MFRVGAQEVQRADGCFDWSEPLECHFIGLSASTGRGQRMTWRRSVVLSDGDAGRAVMLPPEDIMEKVRKLMTRTIVTDEMGVFYLSI